MTNHPYPPSGPEDAQVRQVLALENLVLGLSAVNDSLKEIEAALNRLPRVLMGME